MPKKPLKLIFLLTVILIGAGIWFSFRPVKGSIRPVVQKDTAAETQKTNTPQNFSGQFISFSYPGSFNVQPNATDVSGYLDRVVLLGEGMQSKKMTVGVQKTSEDSVSRISAVQSRRLQSEVYSETKFMLAGVSGLLFSKTAGSFEMTGLVIRNNFLVTISLTSNSVSEISNRDLTADFQTIISSWAWK